MHILKTMVVKVLIKYNTFKRKNKWKKIHLSDKKFN